MWPFGKSLKFYNLYKIIDLRWKLTEENNDVMGGV